MAKFKNILLIILLVIVGFPLLILSIPFLIFIFIFKYFQKKKFEKKYLKFLKENEGKNFFCYNNRKKSKEYLEENIITNLNKEVAIVYLNGRNIESEYNKEFISEALYGLKHYTKFPHLMKIRNGQLIDKSINNPFFGILKMNKPKAELLGEINSFFQ